MLAVRSARPGEGAALVELYGWLFAAPGAMPPDWSVPVAVRRAEAAIASDSSTVLLADDDGELAGFATVYLDLESVRYGQRAWVEDLAVSPGRRSRGVGKALLGAAKQWAADHGATHLRLESGERRLDAHRFYEREQPWSRARSYGWLLPPTS